MSADSCIPVSAPELHPPISAGQKTELQKAAAEEILILSGVSRTILWSDARLDSLRSLRQNSTVLKKTEEACRAKTGHPSYVLLIKIR